MKPVLVSVNVQSVGLVLSVGRTSILILGAHRGLTISFITWVVEFNPMTVLC